MDPNLLPPQMPMNPAMPATGPTMGSQQALLEGMGKPKKEKKEQNPQTMAFDYLANAIKMVNNYIKTVENYDQANARAGQMVLRVLGEMFKTAEFEAKQQVPPSIVSGI